MRVGIVAQRDNARAAYLAADIDEALDPDVDVWVDTETADALDVAGRPAETFADCDLVVSIGGDGTFLFAARNADTTPVLGVNLGEVGFLNGVAPGEAVPTVRRAVEEFRETGTVRARTVPRLAVGDDGGTLTPAINEVAVLGEQRGRNNQLTVEIRVGGELYAATRADGVLVATPTGSTAYNLSEGGPLLTPNVSGLAITAMCPEAPTPSLVADLDAEVTIRVDDADRAFVSTDGADVRTIDPPAKVRIERAAEPARVAGPGLEFFKALGKLE